MPTVTWVLFVALGFLMLKNMPKRRKPSGGGGGARGGGAGGGLATVEKTAARIRKTLDAVMVRAAALCFLVAGMISAGGIPGTVIGWLIDVMGTFGGGLAWVGSLFLLALWAMGMITERIFPGDVPDWLSLSGLLLPPLSAAIPGPVGIEIHNFMVWVHDWFGAWVGSGFGIAA